MTLSQETKAKLQQQVEFYFSDVNVQKDVFLKAKMAENPEGFVSLETLLTFNRVNSITREVSVLSAALQSSQKLVLSDDGLMVRRKDPLPESIQTDNQTVYVKPLPPTATLEELTEFFNKYGCVQAVWRRYFPGKKDATPETRTKPSAFVVFNTKEEAEAFQATPPEYNGVQLVAEMKTAYLDRKAAETAAKKRGRKDNENHADMANARKTPPMPQNSSYRVSGCGPINNYLNLKELWPAEEQAGIRYVFASENSETGFIIFQDPATGEKMIEDLKQRSTTLNGTEPVLQKLEGADEKELLDNVEKEIDERAKKFVKTWGSGHKRKRSRK